MSQESPVTDTSHAAPAASRDGTTLALASVGAVVGFCLGVTTLALLPPHAAGTAAWTRAFFASSVAGPMGALLGFVVTPIAVAMARRAARTVVTLAIMATGTVTGMVGGGIVGAHTLHTLHARIVGASVGALAALACALAGRLLPRRAKA